MENIFLNSFNKKILVLVTFVFLIGLFLKGDLPSKDLNKIYMHENEKNPQAMVKGQSEKASEPTTLKFLPLDEIEQVLRDHQYEEDFVRTDPSFDTKVENITKFLEQRKSPLKEEARFIVIMSNKFEIDYRLLVAISIIESSGGRVLYRPYNAWGWGGSKGFTFENWEHSIYTVSKGLGRYYELGANTPEKMAPRYNPHTPNEWSSKVRGIMNQIGSEL